MFGRKRTDFESAPIGSALGRNGASHMKPRLPSIQALVATDDGLLREELFYLAVREQAAILRTLADQIECLARSGAGGGGQIIEELARLGCRALEAAASMSKSVEPVPKSGLRYLQSSASGSSM